MRLREAGDDLLSSLAASFSGHADWLAGQLEDVRREQARLRQEAHLRTQNGENAASYVVLSRFLGCVWSDLTSSLGHTQLQLPSSGISLAGTAEEPKEEEEED